MKQKILLSIGNFDFTINHLLIIFILSLSFTVSFLLRSLPIDFGWELHEFDPFFNYRATEYIIENGFEKYFSWNDNLSWYPKGRDISSNSQVILHLSAASLYWIFGNSMSVYDFTIIFPVIFGSLTSIVLFALVRKLAGTTAGLFASLLFSVSTAILVRGQLGWFKSEPFGLFLGLFSIYLFFSAIYSKKPVNFFPKIIFAGIFLAFALSAWGGNFFFLIPTGILICALPFTSIEYKSILIKIPIFIISLSLTSMFFERLGIGFISGLSGISLIVPLIIMVLVIIVKHKSIQKNKQRNGLLILLLVISSFALLFSLNDQLEIFSLPTHRYLNAIFPLITTEDALTDSVSEHATLDLSQSFLFHSVLMLLAGFGAWIIISKNSKLIKINPTSKIFLLAMGLFGAYIGSAFMRLEVFTSLGVIILSSIGISILLKYTINNFSLRKKNYFYYIPVFSFLILILIVPLFLPTTGNIIHIATNTPQTILNGGTAFSLSTDDWRTSLEWIDKNTPPDSVIGSWWDYGYWIQTIGKRASLVDNSTLVDHRIKTMAKIFFESPDDAWKSLQEMETDYFVVFIAAQQTNFQTRDSEPIFVLQGGGDESKKYWFGKIAEIEMRKYLESDNFNGTPLFWNETFLGKIIPYELMGYVNLSSDEISEQYIPGWTAIYLKHNKFSNPDDPFHLVYSSKTYDQPKDGKIIGVFVYEINKNYTPKSEEWNSPVVTLY